MKPDNFNQEMKLYFSSLPFFVQENLRHVNVEPRSFQELKQCAQNFGISLQS